MVGRAPMYIIKSCAPILGISVHFFLFLFFKHSQDNTVDTGMFQLKNKSKDIENRFKILGTPLSRIQSVVAFLVFGYEICLNVNYKFLRGE